MRRFFFGARVLDPSQELDGYFNVITENDRIECICAGRPFFESDMEELDLSGLVLVPGLIDVHVHFREPGQEHKETIVTGGLSAAAGGFTQVVAMANTKPAVDSVDVLEYVLAMGALSAVRFKSVGAVTEGLRGKKLAPMRDLSNAGAVAFSDDGFSVSDPKIMTAAFRTAADLGVPVSVHCEDPELWGDRTVNKGPVSRRLGVLGVPDVSEESMIQRDILLARKTGARIHIQHVSTALGAEMIRRAKADGISVTAEATPHHLALTDEAVTEKGTKAKMSPPLRSESDRKALISALSDGTIDVIATDHAPHTEEEKNRSIADAPNGVIGLETALPVVLTEMVQTGKIPLFRVIQAMSQRPSEIFGLPGGSLRPGSVADMTIIDMKKNWVIDSASFFSKGRNTPFDGKKVTGKAVMTVVNGRITSPAK